MSFTVLRLIWTTLRGRSRRAAPFFRLPTPTREAGRSLRAARDAARREAVANDWDRCVGAVV
ncbi:hypothetical protein QOZ99_000486 [Angulomicrobium amanitiforme]|uniref:Uncharacterized protein n=1 Tax=Ancylobacter amanitiformis TaxID=217069 RepID=A0ABU0LLS4_9HYPH|nr:hypothetical protein [Ancylobacter amanitiformis]